MILEILAGSLIIFILAGAALSLGQWFGRPPIEGRCAPRGGGGCGNPACCRSDDGRQEQ